MNSYGKWRLVLGLAALLSWQSSAAQAQEFLDKLLEAAEHARQRYVESKSSMHGAAEKAKEGWEVWKSNARKTTGTLAQEYQKHKPAFQAKARQTHQSVRQAPRKFLEFCERHDFKGKRQYTQKKLGEWVELNQNILTEAQQKTLTNIGPKIIEASQNAEDANGAFKSISAALDIQAQIKAEIKSATRKNLYFLVDAGLDMPLVTDNGTTSLKELNRRKLKKDFPYLVGTDIEADPAGAMTAAILNDKGYYLKELKIVKTKRGVVPINSVIRNPNDYAFEKLQKAINVVNAVDQLQYAADTGKGGLDAVTALVGSVKAVNIQKQTPNKQ